MSDTFTPITTQEEFDEAIKKRLAQQERRHQDAIAALETQHNEALERLKSDHKTELADLQAKLASQDENLAKIANYEKRVTELNEKLKAAQESIAGSTKEIADRDAKIKAYETDSVKTKVAHELKLPYESIGFIQGEDEDSIRKSAEALRGLVGSQTVPLAGGEPANIGETNGHNAAMRSMLKNLNLKGD